MSGGSPSATVSGPNEHVRAGEPLSDAGRSDVWDVLERKLDDVLLLFEFQSNRAQFIQASAGGARKASPRSRLRDHSLRANPIELSPAHIHGDAAEMGAPGVGGAFGLALGAGSARSARLEFYSEPAEDSRCCARERR